MGCIGGDDWIERCCLGGGDVVWLWGGGGVGVGWGWCKPGSDSNRECSSRIDKERATSWWVGGSCKEADHQETRNGRWFTYGPDTLAGEVR